MSKSSVVTVRETPVARTTSASVGGLAVVAENINIDTTERVELVDLTDTVMAFVRRSGVREGLLSLWSMHTTCSVMINESQQALNIDMKALLEAIVNRSHYYMHNDPAHSDCDRQNADSHLRAMLLGHSVTMQVSGGELVRGYRTNAYMPFHSDPTDRVALLCVQKAKRGGLSSIVSSTSLYNEILATHPEALDCLFRGFYYSLRGEGNGGIAQITDYRIPLFDYFAGKLSSRYVRKTIEQGAAVGGAPLTEEERSALDLVDMLAKRDDLRFDMEFEPGDIQYLNNHVAFHSRTGFEDHEQPAMRRHLMRIWLQSEDARPLSPAMSRPHGSRSPFLSREQALKKKHAVR